MSLKVLLADDHKMFRDGLKGLLAKHGLEVVGEADDGLEAVDLALQLHPDIAVIDVTMPKLNGIETTRRILERCPKTRVVMLSMHADRRFVSEALRSGATGYLLKDAAFDELIAALGTVLKGRIYLADGLTDIVLKHLISASAKSKPDAFAVLSSREREVLQLLAEGGSTKEIAQQLHVSTKTVETHRKQLMDKLELHNVADLTKYAIREGLTSLE